MERTVNTKFFTFYQNNSGGYFIVNDDVAAHLVIEAQNAQEAINKMCKITENYSWYCSCCGERWADWVNDGTEEPIVYGIKVKKQRPDDVTNSSTIIYYYDGTKEKLWY